MPTVTVLRRPSGDPTASTGWPTRRLADDPVGIGVSPATPIMRPIAMSLLGSLATTVKGTMWPSFRTAVMGGVGCVLLAIVNTWLLVMMSPSAVRTTPEPMIGRPATSSCSATTPGSAFAATCIVETARGSDCVWTGLGDKDSLPTAFGLTSTATAITIAVVKVRTSRTRTVSQPVRTSLCRVAR